MRGSARRGKRKEPARKLVERICAIKVNHKAFLCWCQGCSRERGKRCWLKGNSRRGEAIISRKNPPFRRRLTRWSASGWPTGTPHSTNGCACYSSSSISISRCSRIDWVVSNCLRCRSETSTGPNESQCIRLKSRGSEQGERWFEGSLNRGSGVRISPDLPVSYPFSSPYATSCFALTKVVNEVQLSTPHWTHAQ